MSATRSWLAAAVALAAAAVLAGCGSDEPTRGGTSAEAALAVAEAAPVTDRPVNSFELYVLASAENNVLFADVYAITMDPMQAHRITAGKRISTMDASTEHLAVAAADELQPDRLAYVTDGGVLTPIPGLGRPYGYTPSFDTDGALLFRKSTASGKDSINRYDPRRRSDSVLRETGGGFGGVVAGPGDRHLQVRDRLDRDDSLVLWDGTEKVREFEVKGQAGEPMWGADWVAVPLFKIGAGFNEGSAGLVLIDPSTGKRKRLPAWDAITWTPDGERLLVRAAGNAADSELALLDPADPDHPEPLGTIPGLVIYTGAWVDRDGT